jgi:hypothetical protein
MSPDPECFRCSEYATVFHGQWYVWSSQRAAVSTIDQQQRLLRVLEENRCVLVSRESQLAQRARGGHGLESLVGLCYMHLQVFDNTVESVVESSSDQEQRIPISYLVRGMFEARSGFGLSFYRNEFFRDRRKKKYFGIMSSVRSIPASHQQDEIVLGIEDAIFAWQKGRGVASAWSMHRNRAEVISLGIKNPGVGHHAVSSTGA